MADLPEIGEALDALGSEVKDRTVLLHCLSDYPGKWEEANLRAMHTLKGMAGLYGHQCITDISHALEDLLVFEDQEHRPLRELAPVRRDGDLLRLGHVHHALRPPLTDPDQAWSDGNQTITPDVLAETVQACRQISSL